MTRSRIAVVLAVLAPSLMGGCGPATAKNAHPAIVPSQWVDQPVNFDAGGVTIFATYRHPLVQTKPMPAALVIAGSGVTDRDGNTPFDPGPVNVLQTVADWLSTDGVVSLRYDKLGSGQTGLAGYAANPGAIGIGPFQEEATAALSFLARQSGVDRGRVAVIGHSEGALFALLLASGTPAQVPPIHALALLEPLSLRYLDLITTQVDAQADAAQRAGRITLEEAGRIKTALANTIEELRATGTVPSNLPPGLPKSLNPTTALFLSQADRYDPGQLATQLPKHMPVLITCSNTDVQVTCTEVDNVIAGLKQAAASIDFVRLTGVDHVLKQDPSNTNYAKPVPFSPQLRDALRAFIQRNL